MDISQLNQLRNQALEQFAQVHADIEALEQRRNALKARAGMVLDDLRQVTAQINEHFRTNPAVEQMAHA